jgi:uncharacterized OB-fold protein
MSSSTGARPRGSEGSSRATAVPPLPVADPTSDFFWAAAREHQLKVLGCADCGWLIHPPRPYCPKCLSGDVAPRTLSGKGKIYSHTVSMIALHPYYVDKVPFVLVTVELIEQRGLHLFSRLVDCDIDDAVVDMQVEVVFDDVAEGLTLPLFRPLDDQ